MGDAQEEEKKNVPLLGTIMTVDAAASRMDFRKTHGHHLSRTMFPSHHVACILTVVVSGYPVMKKRRSEKLSVALSSKNAKSLTLEHHTLHHVFSHIYFSLPSLDVITKTND
jgi:hypothetical protein